MLSKIIMKLGIFRLALFVLILGVVLSGCRSEIIEEDQPQTPEKYQQFTPAMTEKDDINRVFRSVLRVNSVSFYRTYYFLEESEITDPNQPEQELRRYSIQFEIDDISTAGTAVIVYRDAGKMGLLIPAHVVESPDTLITHYEREIDGENIMRSISVKLRQDQSVFGRFSMGSFKIAHSDIEKDLAFIVSDIDPAQTMGTQRFPYRPGDVNNLDWGTHVYALGYPKGYQMITSGIVSIHEVNKAEREFLTDISFNEGFSGGIVLAKKSADLPFEWVGVANSSSASREVVLVPQNESQSSIDMEFPYSGDVYQKEVRWIDSGITKVIPINQVMDFLREADEKITDYSFVDGQWIDGFTGLD
jgi:uncharacterized protein YceK